MSHLIDTYARQPINFTHGAGVRLFDTAGEAYLDGLAGIAVNTLGYAHPKWTAAVTDQLIRLVHTSNLYGITLQEELGSRLCELAQMSAAFICNSGCEANEAAIKLARLYGHRKGVEQPAIIVMENAFHGRTMATLSATGNRKVQSGFEPLVSGFVRVPFDDFEALEKAVQVNASVVAVMFEPVQGEGGVRAAEIDYLEKVRALTDRHELLLMLDEVQCGIGRTGKWFAHQHSNIKPDVMMLAKGLGNGVPVGAALVAGRAHGVFGRGNHGSTFGGNPLACRAALSTLTICQEEQLLVNAERMGQRIRQRIDSGLNGITGYREVRGKGLMIGVELDRDCPAIVDLARQRGLLINVTNGRVIRIVPPLIINESDADELADIVIATVNAFYQTAA